MSLELLAFCAVDRDDDDPRRLAGYRPLDDFWIQSIDLSAIAAVRQDPQVRNGMDWAASEPVRVEPG